MTHIETFKDIIAWQKAHKLVLAIYPITNYLPSNEEFGLKSQIRRAAISIAANIAEGYRRRKKNDRLHFYNISEASLEELKYHILLVHDLTYIDNDCYTKITSQLDEVGRVLHGWIVSQTK
jgi:four helix bundle protein